MTGWHASVEAAAASFGQGVEAFCIAVLGAMAIVGAVVAVIRWRPRP